MSEKYYPKISIITVSYNAVKTIEQTILSVVNQNYENIEYIIIDGGSTDGTIESIKKYEDKIAYWVSEPDNGIYDAMNKGIDRASSDYVYFLGSDDCLINNSIIMLVSKFLDDKCEILCGLVWYVDETYKIQHLSSKYSSSNEILEVNMPHHQGIFARTSLMKKYHFNLKYKIGSDFDFILKCATQGKKFTFIDEKIAFFSNNGVSSKESTLSSREHKLIAASYGIVCNSKTRINSGDKLKKIVKYILKKIKFYRYIQLKNGWKKHSCNNEKCRWCR